MEEGKVMPATTRFAQRGPRFGRPFVGVHLLFVAAFAAAQACSSSGGTTSTPTISLSLSPANGSVAQGASTQFNAVATGSSDFTGTVSFTITGAPSGVTVSAGTPQQSGNVFTAVVTVTA